MSDTDPEEGLGGTARALPGQPETPKKKPRARRVRGITTWVLIVLASLLIPVSVISVWAIRTVTNTDQYVATMAPLARNPAIVDNLATKTTDLLFSSHVVRNKVEDALPAKAKTIVTPIVNQLHSYAYGLASSSSRARSSASCGTRSTGIPTTQSSLSSPVNSRRSHRRLRRTGRSRSISRPLSIR